MLLQMTQQSSSNCGRCNEQLHSAVHEAGVAQIGQARMIISILQTKSHGCNDVFSAQQITGIFNVIHFIYGQFSRKL